MTATWPDRVALAAALAAPLLAWAPPADAAPRRVPSQCGASIAAAPGRAWVPERRPVAQPCRLRPIVRVPSVWGGVR
jgi:hypothetical protein